MQQLLICYCFFLAGILQLGRALVVKPYLAQKMQISPKIPHGSKDELLLNMHANTEPASLCDYIISFFVVTFNVLWSNFCVHCRF